MNIRKYNIIEKVFLSICTILESDDDTETKITSALKYKSKAEKIEVIELKEVAFELYDELAQNLRFKTLSFKTSCDMLDILIRFGFQSNDRFIGDYSLRLGTLYGRLSTIVHYLIKDEIPFQEKNVYTADAYKYYSSEVSSFNYTMMQYLPKQ